jgi:hypothetical protein
MAINIFFRDPQVFFQVISDHHWRLAKLQEVINEVIPPWLLLVFIMVNVVNHG